VLVDFSGANLSGITQITSLDAPHRVYDAILRDSQLDGKPFMDSDQGPRLAKAKPEDASALLEISPTALLFGAWHSTGEGGGVGAKFARCHEDDAARTAAIHSIKIKMGSNALFSVGAIERNEIFPDVFREIEFSESHVPEHVEDLKLAGFMHDTGKADPRFQAWLHYGDPLGADPDDEKTVLAKSSRPLPPTAHVQSDLPAHWRHEAHSVKLARAHKRVATAHDPDLVLWLIGSHHGHGRPFFPHGDPTERTTRCGAAVSRLRLAWSRLVNGICATQSPLWRVGARAHGSHPAACRSSRIRRKSEEKRRMTSALSHRLDGLEPDNLLAFLALLGLLRALEAFDDSLHPRAAWDIDAPPLRPRLFLARAVTLEEVMEIAAKGIEVISKSHAFGGRKDLNYSRDECRALLNQEARAARPDGREHADLLAALMSDAAIKDDKKELVDPTPLCLLFGQGHQHFLDRLAGVPQKPAPPPRGAVSLSASECLAEALVQPWRRNDPTFSFRWDPEEDVRYALMAGDPTDRAYKPGTQHGANRLAAIGLAALTLVPEMRAGRVRPSIIGGASEPHGFSFAWPIWREPATLSAIRALLAHPELRTPGALKHLGVDHVVVSRRISVGKFMNFSRARPLDQIERHHGLG
jgi:CRISPR-associated protein GSU0053 (Cas_GSU0053)